MVISCPSKDLTLHAATDKFSRQRENLWKTAEICWIWKFPNLWRILYKTYGNKLPILGIYFHKFFIKSFHKFENFCFRPFLVFSISFQFVHQTYKLLHAVWQLYQCGWWRDWIQSSGLWNIACRNAWRLYIHWGIWAGLSEELQFQTICLETVAQVNTGCLEGV